MVEQPRPVSRQLSDPMQFKVVWEPNRYNRQTTLPITFVPIVADVPLGFLWYCDEDDAARYLPRASGGVPAMQAGPGWAAILLEAREAGLSPSEAVLVWAARIDGVRLGKVDTSDPKTSTLTELEALAANS
ncbi:hypothetical protein SAMN05444157_0987 [Frankineae bacterium MT45]|nr:hypothetical protein SAMN05444157_0987 [Frankineae bacterium MT45]